LEIPATAPE